MAEVTAKTYTYEDVKANDKKSALWMVIHDKVYDATKFVDEHPGGEEVMLDVAGQDATEAFEDVGHSDEAREILEGLLVGDLERKPGDPKPSVAAPSSSLANAGTNDNATGFGIGLYAVILVGGALAYGAWQYLEAQKGQK